MKRNLIVLSGVILLVFSIVGTTSLANKKEENNKTRDFKLIYDDKYVLDEKLNEGYNLIIAYEDEILYESIVTETDVVKLDKIKIPKDEIISYWNVRSDENQYFVTPVTADKKDVNINFSTTKGGSISGETLLPSLNKTVKEGTKLNEILPNIQTKENFYFAGWFTLEDVENEVEIKEKDREDIKKLNEELKKKEKEKGKSKKKKKLNKEIEELKEEIENLKKEKKYETEVFTEYQKVEDIDNIELSKDKEYVAVVYPDINNNGKDDRKEKITISVDFGLDNDVEEKEIHVGQPIKLSTLYHEDFIFIDWFLDEDFNERLRSETLFEEDTSIYAKWKTVEELVAEGGENLIVEERVSDEVENYINEINNYSYEQQKENHKKKQEELKENHEDDFLAQHTEKRYSFKNFNEDQMYLTKFYNDEEFLFSVVLPYGRTLEIVNGNDQKIKEYGVRQDTSIDLNEFIINGNSENMSFDIKTIKKNNAVITQIYPTNNKEMN